LDEIFRLGTESRLCIGIELAGEDIAERKVELHAKEEPALEILRALLASVGHYGVVERGGILLIRDRRVQGPTPLDYTIRKFEIARAPVQAASRASGTSGKGMKKPPSPASFIRWIVK